MTKVNAQRIQGAIGLASMLGVAGVKLYAMGWLDDWRIVLSVFGGLNSLFAFFWTRHELRIKRDRDALNDHWESRQSALKRRGPSSDDSSSDRHPSEADQPPRDRSNSITTSDRESYFD